MLKSIQLLCCALVLSGCARTLEDIENNPGSAHAQRLYSSNYQEVYRRLSETAKKCQSTGGSAAFTVDAQLYNELGYGTVDMAIVSIYGRNNFWKAKIEKSGGGSLVSVSVASIPAKNKYLGMILRWADGDTNC